MNEEGEAGYFPIFSFRYNTSFHLLVKIMALAWHLQMQTLRPLTYIQDTNKRVNYYDNFDDDIRQL